MLSTDKLAKAIADFASQLGSKNVGTLAQVWVPEPSEDGGVVLNTQGLPFCVIGAADLLALFRCISCKYKFSTDTTKPCLMGPVGRVYTSGQAELSRNVQQYDQTVYIRVAEAARCQINSCMFLPVYDTEGRDQPAAVLEIVQTESNPAFVGLASWARTCLETAGLYGPEEDLGEHAEGLRKLQPAFTASAFESKVEALAEPTIPATGGATATPRGARVHPVPLQATTTADTGCLVEGAIARPRAEQQQQPPPQQQPQPLLHGVPAATLAAAAAEALPRFNNNRSTPAPTMLEDQEQQRHGLPLGAPYGALTSTHDDGEGGEGPPTKKRIVLTEHTAAFGKHSLNEEDEQHQQNHDRDPDLNLNLNLTHQRASLLDGATRVPPHHPAAADRCQGIGQKRSLGVAPAGPALQPSSGGEKCPDRSWRSIGTHSGTGAATTGNPMASLDILAAVDVEPSVNNSARSDALFPAAVAMGASGQNVSSERGEAQTETGGDGG